MGLGVPIGEGLYRWVNAGAPRPGIRITPPRNFDPDKAEKTLKELREEAFKLRERYHTPVATYIETFGDILRKSPQKLTSEDISILKARLAAIERPTMKDFNRALGISKEYLRTQSKLERYKKYMEYTSAIEKSPEAISKSSKILNRILDRAKIIAPVSVGLGIAGKIIASNINKRGEDRSGLVGVGSGLLAAGGYGILARPRGTVRESYKIPRAWTFTAKLEGKSARNMTLEYRKDVEEALKKYEKNMKKYNASRASLKGLLGLLSGEKKLPQSKKLIDLSRDPWKIFDLSFKQYDKMVDYGEQIVRSLQGRIAIQLCYI